MQWKQRDEILTLVKVETGAKALYETNDNFINSNWLSLHKRLWIFIHLINRISMYDENTSEMQGKNRQRINNVKRF